jgi:aryl-alcohol dehydrogenase-like predicted oxidoreductase
MDKSRLIIGTAQFGMPYGIANHSGQPSPEEVSSILSYASHKGIVTLDTALGYGETETVLGSIGISSWNVISKIPQYKPKNKDAREWIQSSVNSSINRLKVSKLHGALIHDASDLKKPFGKELYQALCNMKKHGLVQKTGVSIYDASDIEWLVDAFDFDIIQAPFNVFDQELKLKGYFEILINRGIEIHARSVFLQGLLLLKESTRPDKFSKWSALFSEWDEFIKENSITRLEACLMFVSSHSEVDRIIIGVDSLKQLKEIISAVDKTESVNFPEHLRCKDKLLTKPLHWNTF